MSDCALSAAQIKALFVALDEQLGARGVRGEIYVIGGAVMCLVFGAREATRDVDALFAPTREVREAAARVGLERGLPADWLNDAAKGFLSSNASFAPFLTLPNLSVSTATPEYLLAMKCLAMRLGAEFHDEADIRYLLRYLNVETHAAAVAILESFYPLAQFPQKTLYALEELLER
ncbi:MAG: hypothetical protein IPI67_33360 [Myxococcales bacterium]|nr:hypothetical protein [Myxococcales bacterium]